MINKTSLSAGRGCELKNLVSEGGGAEVGWDCAQSKVLLTTLWFLEVSQFNLLTFGFPFQKPIHWMTQSVILDWLIISQWCSKEQAKCSKHMRFMALGLLLLLGQSSMGFFEGKPNLEVNEHSCAADWATISALSLKPGLHECNPYREQCVDHAMQQPSEMEFRSSFFPLHFSVSVLSACPYRSVFPSSLTRHPQI